MEEQHNNDDHNLNLTNSKTELTTQPTCTWIDDHENDHNKQQEELVYEKGENRRMLKNVIIISLSFTLLFTAFSSMSGLQSSINTEDGLGIYSLSTVYGAIVISAMFVPTFVIQRFSAKTCVVFSMLGYITYIGAQFYPTFWTLIPTGIIVGVCGAPLWAAKCMYLTQVGHQYARLVEQNVEIVIVRFFGIFFFLFQTSQIWGNLISSTILSFGLNKTMDDHDNLLKDISICGRTFCPSNAREEGVIIKPSNLKIYILASIFLIVAMSAACVVAYFVDPLKRYGERTDGVTKKSTKMTIIATFQQMRNPIQALIIPLTLWSGIEQGFYSADFTQAYVSCSWGVEKLGYVGICFGICDALASIGFGVIVKYLGRISVFIFGALLNIGVIIVLHEWEPNPDTPIIFFVIAGCWGIADAVWQTQINALYGNLFSENEEAAFSNYRLWESLGFIVAFINGNLICVNAKLYTLLGVLGIGMIGYFTIEIIQRLKNDGVKEK